MNLAEIKAAAEESLAHTWDGGEVPLGSSIPGAFRDAVRAEKANARNVLWLVERCEELHKVATVLLGAYGRCAAYTLDDLHLSREERAWVDRVLAETREP